LIYFDTETTGLHSPIVLIQYAIDDGPIILHEVWRTPIHETLSLIEKFMDHEEGVCGFNLSFDHFHLCQTYTTLSLFSDKNTYPEDYINEIALLEPEARNGKCLKPKKAFDVMLHARKGPYQSTMDRGDIRVKKIPNVLAISLMNELEKRVKLKDIYFARRKNKYSPKWQIFEIEDEPNFKDIVLKFKPSNALKALAVDALGITSNNLILYGDIELDRKLYPEEIGYAPFALAIGNPRNWKNAWPDKIQFHIDHWAYNKSARQYAKDDVKYTRDLYKYFDRPETNDDDSVLACAVGAARWKGFAINLEKIKEIREDAIEASKKAPTAPNAVRRYVLNLLSEEERLILQNDNTSKEVLKTIAEFKIKCPECIYDDTEETDIPLRLGCNNSNCIDGYIPHPASLKAQKVIDARTADKEIDLYDKLLLAGRFHADFNIIGTLSSRMSGTSGLNAQGIKATIKVRECFTLADFINILCGGDFQSFEVTLADACYNDPKLREDLMKGVSIHGVFGTFMYPPMTYDQIMASKGTSNDKYKVSKNCLFSVLYGAEEYTLTSKYGVNIEAAQIGLQMFMQKYPNVGLKRREIQNRFCSMRQDVPHGKVEWSEPADYIESMLGFRRYFTLENNICRILFNLAENPPKDWFQFKTKVVRRDREQTPVGSVRSALFASAFALQAANMRAAGNHVIQSTGATLTKSLQRKIWDLQPNGINDWYVQPFNCHDEVLSVTHPTYVNKVKEVVDNFINETKKIIPLIGIDWKDSMNSWADK
jgi:hypothetical protein